MCSFSRILMRPLSTVTVPGEVRAVLTEESRAETSEHARVARRSYISPLTTVPATHLASSNPDRESRRRHHLCGCTSHHHVPGPISIRASSELVLRVRMHWLNESANRVFAYWSFR